MIILIFVVCLFVTGSLGWLTHSFARDPTRHFPATVTHTLSGSPAIASGPPSLTWLSVILIVLPLLLGTFLLMVVMRRRRRSGSVRIQQVIIPDSLRMFRSASKSKGPISAKRADDSSSTVWYIPLTNHGERPPTPGGASVDPVSPESLSILPSPNTTLITPVGASLVPRDQHHGHLKDRKTMNDTARKEVRGNDSLSLSSTVIHFYKHLHQRSHDISVHQNC